MTVGSWDRSFGTTTYQRNWNGTDAPSLPPRKRVKPEYRTVRLANGGRYRFRVLRDGVDPPPKRGRDRGEHAFYSKTHFRQDPICDYKDAGGNPQYGAIGLWEDGKGMSHVVPFFTLSANDQLKLLGKLREKLSGSDFNMSVFLGEGHKTLQMIGDTAIRIAKSIHHLRKGDLAGTARSLLEGTSRKPLKPYKEMKPFKPAADRVSSHWLELQYGWLPLLKDVEAGAQALAHQLSVPARQTYRMSIRREYSAKFTKTSGGATVTSERITQQFRFLKVIVSEHPSLIQKLGLTDPLNVAWELVPFSFVVDWFLPIGSWLEARAITSIVKGTYVTSDYMSSKLVYHDLGVLKPRGPVGSRLYELNRYVGGAPPLPLPKMKSLSEAASVKHVLNGIALLTQAFVKR